MTRAMPIGAALCAVVLLAGCSSSGSGGSPGSGRSSGSGRSNATPGTSGASATESGVSSKGGHPDTVTACSVLTPADLQRQFGGNVGSGESRLNGGEPDCKYDLDGGSLGTGVSIHDELDTDSAEDVASWKQNRTEAVQEHEETMVDVPGTLAYYNPTGSNPLVEFVKGNQVVITFTELDTALGGTIEKQPDKLEAALTALANDEAARV